MKTLAPGLRQQRENYSDGLVINLLENSLNATGATMVLGGITIPVVGAAGVVLLASALCVFRLTRILEQQVSQYYWRTSLCNDNHS